MVTAKSDSGSQLEVKIVSGESLPNELVSLRRDIYQQEKDFLSEKDLFSTNDQIGKHLCVYESGKLIAAVQFIEAEKSDVSHHSGISDKTLKECIYGSRAIVHPSARGRGLFSFMMYLVMREARMMGRTTFLSYVEPGDIRANRLLKFEYPKQISPRTVYRASGQPYTVVLAGQKIDYGMHLCFESLSPELKIEIRPFMAQEIEQTVRRRVQQLYANTWFKTVEAKQLTRLQYLDTLANLHQFVRWTTRLLARVISISSEKSLRANYIDHLAGEVDHEVLIENDVKYLGGDVDYVKNKKGPAPGIRMFMSLQESLSAFHQDPVLFLAVPFTIEGLSAHLSTEFITALNENIRSWGYSQPQKASTFLTSHIHTDGGDDGHWEMSRAMIQKFVQDESLVQKFLTVVHLVAESQEIAFAGYVEQLDISSLKPETGLSGAKEMPHEASSLNEASAF